MSSRHDLGKWVGGLAEWHEGDTCFLSIAFTYKIPEAYPRAVFARACGKRVIAGGPALFDHRMRAMLESVAEIPLKRVLDDEGREINVPADHPNGEAVNRHNPRATFASRGCPVGCWFCTVPRIEGKKFTLIPDFPVRPILCDNNLSALPAEYQDHIVERYRAERVPLLDANSGFEPQTFTDEVFLRWKPIMRGPWRFAFDEWKESREVLRVLKMLEGVRSKMKRVYVLIGNEPIAECLARIQLVLDHGAEPHVQPYMKLTSLEREPNVRFDWTRQKLKDVARWANRYGWKDGTFAEYDRFYRRHAVAERYDEQEGLFA